MAPLLNIIYLAEISGEVSQSGTPLILPAMFALSMQSHDVKGII